MYLCDQQNSKVCTLPMFKPTANIHRHLSPTDVNVFPPPFLPAELIVDILQRLPDRSLLQFSCVCKLWKTLISEIHLAKKRLAFSSCQNTYSYPLKKLLENPSDHVIPDRFTGLENDGHYILGSCNGFICLYDVYQCNIIMYNPFIGLKSKSSPKISSPNCSMPYNGFGYDHVNDKYKVLAVVDHDDDSDDEDFGESFTKIYTFGEDSWRTIQDFPITFTEQLGKYVSGTLNWVCNKGYKQYVILSFDLEKETYLEVLLPQNVGGNYMCRPSLFVLHDCLCVCFVNKTHLVVWLMKEYGVVESWTKLMSIPCEKLIFLNSLKAYSTIIDILFISVNGVVLFKVSSQLILYNLNSGGLDYPLLSIGGVFDPHVYRENLISP